MESERISTSFKKNWIITVLLILIVALFFFEFYNNRKLSDKISNISMEQNIERIKSETQEPSFNGRFQIYTSPITVKNTFLIDNKEGIVYNLVQDPDTKKLWWTKTIIEGQ